MSAAAGSAGSGGHCNRSMNALRCARGDLREVTLITRFFRGIAPCRRVVHTMAPTSVGHLTRTQEDMMKTLRVSCLVTAMFVLGASTLPAQASRISCKDGTRPKIGHFSCWGHGGLVREEIAVKPDTKPTRVAKAKKQPAKAAKLTKATKATKSTKSTKATTSTKPIPRRVAQTAK
jgi:hypothetical protein